MHCKVHCKVALTLFVFMIMAACSPLVYQRVAAEIDTIRPSIGAHEIVVTSAGSDVTLEGFVRSQEIRDQVERRAWSVRGVETVHNRLEVRPVDAARASMATAPMVVEPTDSDILRELSDLAKAERNYDVENLQLRVQDGVVFLTGNTSSFRNVDRLLSNLVSVDGVSRIENGITIDGRPYGELQFKK